MNSWSRDELERAHQHYKETAGRCAASGQWREWADLFTDDAVYLEHTFGTFHGPDEIYNWIAPLMAEWPNKAMNAFPHSWCVCDEERGWWICRIENRMQDPGDGSVHQAHNITVLHYAGDMKFSYEEDAYNPAAFGPMIQGWQAAYDARRCRRRRAGEPPASAEMAHRMSETEVVAFLKRCRRTRGSWRPSGPTGGRIWRRSGTRWTTTAPSSSTRVKPRSRAATWPATRGLAVRGRRTAAVQLRGARGNGRAERRRGRGAAVGHPDRGPLHGAGSGRGVRRSQRRPGRAAGSPAARLEWCRSADLAD